MGPDIMGKLRATKSNPWVLELEDGEAEEKFGVKKDGPWFLYKGSGD